MKRIMPALFLLALSSCGGSQSHTMIHSAAKMGSYKRIAILPFQCENADGRAMADAFVTGFMTSDFLVVERGLIEGIIRAQNLDLSSGALKPEDLSKVGAGAKVDAVVFGTVNAKTEKQGGEIMSVSLRMVDVRTGEVVLSSTFRNSSYLEAPEIPRMMMKDIRKKYRRFMKKARNASR